MLQRIGAISPGYQRILLILGCLILFGVWLVRVPLIEVDETRYVESTREMFESHNFLIPHYNYTPRYAKPIFYYWVQSASTALFGQNEMAARLPSLVLGILLVLLLHAFLLRLFNTWSRDYDQHWQLAGRGAAFLGAVSLATLPLFAPWTRLAVTDVTLTFLISMALLTMLLAAIEPQYARRWYLLTALACGLAFLTKGPVGVIIPVAVWFIFHLRQKTIGQEIRRIPWIPAILLFLLIGLPWYIATYFTPDGHGFLRQFFVAENGSRFARDLSGRTVTLLDKVEDLFEFLLGTIAMIFPFNAFLAHELAAPLAGNTVLQRDEVFNRVRRFAWIWMGVVFCIFAAAQTRGLNYVQSISAAVAIIFALHLFARFTRQPEDMLTRAWKVGLVIERSMLLVFGAAFIGSIIYILENLHPNRREWEVPFPLHLATLLLALTALVAFGYFANLFISWLRRSDARVIGGTMVAWTALTAIALIGLAPMYFSCIFSPVAEAGSYLRTLPVNEPVATYMTRSNAIDTENPEDLVYYARRKVQFHSIKDRDALEKIFQTLAAQPSMLVVTDWLGLHTLEGRAEVKVLKRFDFFIVVRLTPRKDGVIWQIKTPYKTNRSILGRR